MTCYFKISILMCHDFQMSASRGLMPTQNTLESRVMYQNKSFRE